MDWAAIILPAVVSGACACWAAYGAGRRRGASEALKTVEGALEPLLADGEPLPRDKGRFGSFFAPGEKVTIRADPTPTLAGLGRYEEIAGGSCRRSIDRFRAEVEREIERDTENWFRSRIAERLTEWQREQAA